MMYTVEFSELGMVTHALIGDRCIARVAGAPREVVGRCIPTTAARGFSNILSTIQKLDEHIRCSVR
jgi:hypothetical protein